MGQPKVSVVLVNFRGVNDTLSAIESIQKSNYPKDLIEIVVVDNNSNDDSVKKLNEISRDALNLYEYHQTKLNAKKEN